MNLAPALAVLPQTDITLLVRTGDAWVKGDHVKGSEADGVTFRGVVQPFPERLMRSFPTGEQVYGAKLIHTTHELQTADEAAQTAADVVRINGERFKIASVGDWSQMGFYRYAGVLEP